MCIIDIRFSKNAPRPSGRKCPSAPAGAAHAELIGANLCCARCHTLIYCSRPCQVAHWTSGGHKQECKGLARAHRDTNLEVQSRALAHVSHMSGGAPDDAHCLFGRWRRTRSTPAPLGETGEHALAM